MPHHLLRLLLLVYALPLTSAFTTTTTTTTTTCPRPPPHPPNVTYWENLRSPPLTPPLLVLFPLGSIETHGAHLPVGTDLYLARTLSAHAASHLAGVAVLPASPFGASFEHASHPGTLPIHDSPLNALWTDVLAGVRRGGVRKVILVNAHGGQTANAQIAARSVRFAGGGMVVVFNVQAMLGKAWRQVGGGEEGWERRYGIHGGVVETAVMRYLFPELVGERRGGGEGREWEGVLQPHGQVVSFGWRVEDLGEGGVVGGVEGASADVGKKVFEESVRVLRGLVEEVLGREESEVLPGMRGKGEG